MTASSPKVSHLRIAPTSSSETASRNVCTRILQLLQRESSDSSRKPVPTWQVKHAITRAVSGVSVQPQLSTAMLGEISTARPNSSAPIAITRATSRMFAGTSGSPGSGVRGSRRWLRHHRYATIHGDRM